MSEEKRCKACQEVPDTCTTLRCGFLNGTFSDTNWVCRTTSQFRQIFDKYMYNNIVGLNVHMAQTEQRYATLDVGGVEELWSEDEPNPVSLYVGWYKDRGRTECMWLMFESEPPRPPNESECLAILEHWKPILVKFDMEKK